MEKKTLLVSAALCVVVLRASLGVAAIDETSSTHIETIEVTAISAQTQLYEEQALIPGGVSVLDGDELLQRNVSSLEDMMRYVPGVWAPSHTSTDNVFLSSRGSNLDATNYDMNGVKMLQDGLPVTTADGNNHNRILDPLSASRAIFARGSNAMSYGASNLGGAINFISPTARDVDPLELYINGGSHGSVQTRVTAATLFAEGQGDGLITLEGKHWDGYRGHNRQDREGLYSNIGWQFSDEIDTRFYLTYVDNDQELAGALTKFDLSDDPEQAAPKAESGHYQVDVETWRLANKTTIKINDQSSLEVGISWEKQRLYHPIVDKVLVDFDGPGPKPPVEVFSLLINTDHRELAGLVRYKLEWENHNLLAGIHFGQNDVSGGQYRNDGGRANGLTTRIDNSARSVETYLLDRWQFAPKWRLEYGLQGVYAEREVKNETVASSTVRKPGDDYHSINPRLGLTYTLNDDVDLFTNVSRVYEAPTNYELEDDIRGSGETLDAMRGVVFEVGSRGQHQWGRHSWNWDASLYYARIRDEILSVDDPMAPGTSLSANVDKTTHAGLELLTGARWLLDDAGRHTLEPLLNFTFNHFRFDDDPVYGNNDLPAAPGFVARAELLYRNANGLYAGPTLDVVDDRYVDFNNSYEVDNYSLVGFRSGYEGTKWRVFLEFRNLLDRDYVSTHSVVDRYNSSSEIFYGGEPRSVYAGLHLRF
jgi:iron complex outermembrane receptor protein